MHGGYESAGAAKSSMCISQTPVGVRLLCSWLTALASYSSTLACALHHQQRSACSAKFHFPRAKCEASFWLSMQCGFTSCAQMNERQGSCKCCVVACITTLFSVPSFFCLQVVDAGDHDTCRSHTCKLLRAVSAKERGIMQDHALM